MTGIETIETNTKQLTKEDKLRFKEIYQSFEWKQLDSVDRAQLLLVAEGVKPGAIIGGDFTNFKNVVKKMGLVATLNTHPFILYPVYTVSTPQRISEYYRKVLSVPEGITPEEFHRINGEFLGYPPCCIEEYIKPQNNLEARKKYSPSKVISNVDFEVAQLLEKGKIYSEELDFCPPAFTPCSAYCPRALEILRTWKEILELADLEAAKELQIFNWQIEPYSQAHEEELKKRR